MYYLFLSLHLFIALLLGVVVLLQRSKGNGLAGAFGGVGAGEAMFGSHGVTTVLHKATIYLAIAFMLTSLSLVYLTAQRGGGSDAGPARSTDGVVLPVGTGATTVPDEPIVTPEGTATDDVVPAGNDEDSIVPAAGDTDAGTTEESTDGTPDEEATEEGSTEGGR